MSTKMITTIFSVLLFVELCSAASWSYEGNTGPNFWMSLNYSACDDQAQSPIDLPSTMSMTYKASLGKFTLSGFDNKDAYSLLLKNNGHTAQVDIDNPGNSLKVQGGGLPSTFYPAQFHFHWGPNDNKGSEHTHLGQSFPLELHLVTYNSKYENLSTAADKSDGLAVLGFFFEVGNTLNCNYNPVLDYLADVNDAKTNKSIPSFKLRHLLPETMDKFYRYQGSLTTPPCYESVTWTVFEEKIKLSTEQFAKFRNLYEEGNTKKITVNYRPVQARNARTIYINYNPIEDINSAPSMSVSHLAICFLGLLVVLLR